jgi:hypothetical protein
MRGIFAKSDIAKGETVLFVPQHLIFKKTDILDSEVIA